MPDRYAFAQPEVNFFSRLSAIGWSPKCVFDVGASEGQWSEAISKVFPSARFELFEPLAKAADSYGDMLGPVLKRNENFTLHPIAATDANGEVVIHISADNYSSSMHGHASSTRSVSTQGWRLADYCREKSLDAPQLLKVDVQGAEDKVIRGCGEMLNRIDVIHLETWLRRGYGPNTPLLTEMIEQLREHQFVLVETGNQFITQWNEILHIDGFFLRKDFILELKRASAGDPVLWFGNAVQHSPLR